jgi:hypothetical protein
VTVGLVPLLWQEVQVLPFLPEYPDTPPGYACAVMVEKRRTAKTTRPLAGDRSIVFLSIRVSRGWASSLGRPHAREPIGVLSSSGGRESFLLAVCRMPRITNSQQVTIGQTGTCTDVACTCAHGHDVCTTASRDRINTGRNQCDQNWERNVARNLLALVSKKAGGRWQVSGVRSQEVGVGCQESAVRSK